ncbi:formyltetrahydrofolate deformylase [Hydrogenovibrio sp. JE_KL2]|uniref:formyltetrahydrofolate deformylase n=1 Tax=Hydrogenovibrio sp. JE_KL2 TaxID=2651188 RepID=UPI00128D26D9|nr:formyltetrahydrofolate deformylase [Hydrogenovibrio sp. JE_KL2]MBN2607206.1 formyltetrahydrofolate deformylase [Thiotrichales bacterium]MPQ76415.1 formyltetrahydrofolate deformylase [Hydrogenovibrio sp. JE_KL2]
MSRVFRLVISCPDQVGIVAKVASFIADQGGSIVEANHHTETMDHWFFMRHEILASSLNNDLDGFKEKFRPIAEAFNMQWQVFDSAKPKRIALFASKESHCLADLLYRWHEKDLPGEVACVIANHDDLRSMVEWYQVPFHHVPVTPETKPEAFAKSEELAAKYEADVIVLARYMQILPPNMCRDYAGKVINIHHSFLPSFVGAKPYHQAYERGVKLIGATCHYVTEELDAGPIIEQEVIRVNHSQDIEDLKRLGRDVEKITLSRGLRYHLEDRVLIHGNKTVVFAP